MDFKEIMIWLFIFIVGSLVVSFIISPSSMSVVGDGVSNIKSLFQYQKEDVNYTEVNVPKDFLSCSLIEMMAEANRMSSRNSKENTNLQISV